MYFITNEFVCIAAVNETISVSHLSRRTFRSVSRRCHDDKCTSAFRGGPLIPRPKISRGVINFSIKTFGGRGVVK